MTGMTGPDATIERAPGRQVEVVGTVVYEQVFAEIRRLALEAASARISAETD